MEENSILSAEQEISNKLNLYFNTILKKSLNYNETYNIKVDIQNRSILLIPDLSNAKLIELLKISDFQSYQSYTKNYKLKNQLELSLLNGLRTKYPDVLNVNIYTNTSTIVAVQKSSILITYTLGDIPFQINDIEILARLAAEYVDNKIEQVCQININFNKACKDDTFWWKIIEIKYPKYVINKNRNKYNPKEVLKGMIFFVGKFSVEYKIKNTISINDFVNKYYETFKYLLLEKLWTPDYNDYYYIFSNIVGERSDDLKIFKFMLLINQEFEIPNNVSKLTKYILFENPKTGIEFIKQINEWLFSIGKEKLSTNEDIKDLLIFYFNELNKDNVEVYKFLLGESDYEITHELYLDHYLSLNPDNKNIREYIFSQLSDDITEEEITEILDDLLKMGFFYSFEAFYKRFNKISVKSKLMLIEEVIRLDDEDKSKYLNLLYLI